MSRSVPPATVLTVTELTRRIKGLLEERFPGAWIEGEISNLRQPGSGHYYFTLKDAGAQINAVLFRGPAQHLTFQPKDGLAVVAFGDISVYEKSGQYQIIVRKLQPKGLGDLQRAFAELKAKLQAEGLFDPARKKNIPVLPQRIGLVTSPTGAAIRDFLNIIGRRYPNVHIIIHPVRVQGAGAAAEIAGAIDDFNELTFGRARPPGAPTAGGQPRPVDVIIVTRGGGSLEDLWAFNEEIVARALARSRIPTISAIGHEIDFTISDFVADLRTPTPSAAAELVATAKQEIEAQLEDYRRRLDKDLRLRVAETRQRLTALSSSYVFRQPAEVIRQYQQQVDDLAHRLRLAADSNVGDRLASLELLAGKFHLLSPQSRLARWRDQLTGNQRRFTAAFAQQFQFATHRLGTAHAKLDLLSPKSTLARGYSITRLADGRLVKSVTGVKPGDSLTTLVTDGLPVLDRNNRAVRGRARPPGAPRVNHDSARPAVAPYHRQAQRHRSGSDLLRSHTRPLTSPSTRATLRRDDSPAPTHSSRRWRFVFRLVRGGVGSQAARQAGLCWGRTAGRWDCHRGQLHR